MVKITEKAAALLSEARASSGAPQQFGVRFYVIADSPAQGKSLGFEFVDSPEPRDEVDEQQGLPVYVAPELTTVAADGTVDARETDGRNQLVLRPASNGGGR
jgi:Fe-S cluster assembly iron-binding protein IscA